MSRPIPGFARASTPAAYAPDPELEPVHLDLSLTVDVDGRRVEGELTWTLTASRDKAQALRLDAVDFEQLEVLTEGLSHRYDGEALHVRWPEAAARGEQRQLRLRFAVERPTSGLVFGDAPQRFMATDHETSRARNWLPCVDHPVVRFGVDIAITAEAGLTALSAGARVSTADNGDGSATTTYRLEQRCPAYLLCVAVGDFVTFDDGEWRGRPVRAYAPRPHTVAELEQAFGPTKTMLSYLSEKLGLEMPWPKYEQFAAAGVGGAMENISLVSWDDLFLGDARYHAEIGWLFDLINLHEMAHTWFGDLLVCREFAHAWLKESWATYMESVWLEDTEGPDAMHGQLYDEAYLYTSESDSRYARPIVTRHHESGWDMFDAHLYPGGALRLHMLRKEIGDEVFWDATRDYLQRFQRKVVDTDDFRKVMEEHSGRNLNSFFDQWLRSPGYPQLEVACEHDADEHACSLTFTQAQVNEDKGIGLFSFPLTVAVQHRDGRWERHVVRISERVTGLRFAAKSCPHQLILDPDSDALFKAKFNPGLDMLRRSLTAPSVRGRINAAETLCGDGGRQGVHAVRDAWTHEQDWRVRRAWARALGASERLEAADVLAELVTQEADARVLTVLGQACEAQRSEALAEALRARISKGDLPYRAMGHMLTALGSHRGDANVGLLQGALSDDPSWGWVQRGALAGLGQTWSEQALPSLAAAVDDEGLRRSARLVAGPAYAACAQSLGVEVRRRAVDRLAKLGSASDYGLRMSAAQGLFILGEAAGAGHILSIAARASVQDRPRLERLADSLRGRSDDAAVKKQLEELQGELKRLQAEVAKLSAGAPSK